MTYRHPIRNLPVWVWQAPEGQQGPRWIAKFGPGHAFPIHFVGETEAEVRAKAEQFRAETIEQNEAAYIARQENIAKAREARLKRKSADGGEQP